MPAPPPVTASFLSMIRATYPNGRGALTLPISPPLTLYVQIGEGGAWSMGTGSAGAYTLSEEAWSELYASTANTDGTFTNANNVVRALTATDAGAALPSDPPPPPPP